MCAYILKKLKIWNRSCLVYFLFANSATCPGWNSGNYELYLGYLGINMRHIYVYMLTQSQIWSVLSRCPDQVKGLVWSMGQSKVISDYKCQTHFRTREAVFVCVLFSNNFWILIINIIRPFWNQHIFV